MANTNYYALPALTNLTNPVVNGLSLTSGGAPIASVTVSSTDTIGFDANSGPGRAIAGTTSCSAFSVNNAAGAFVIASVTIYASVTLNSSSSITSLAVNGASTIKCNGGYIANLTLNNNAELYGVGNFGAISTGSYNFMSNGYSFSCSSIQTSSTAGGTWDFGYSSCTVTINASSTGSGTTYLWNRYGLANYSMAYLVVNFASDNAAARASLGPLTTITSLTVRTTGPGFVVIPSGMNLAKFTLNGNATLPAGNSLSAQGISIDGNGAYGGVAKIMSASANSPAVITKTAGGVTYLDRMQATDITFATNVTHSRSDQGSIRSTGFDTVPGNTKFLQFF